MTMHPKFLRSGATTAAVAVATASILAALVGTAVSSQGASSHASSVSGQPQPLAATGAACRITQHRSGAAGAAISVRFINHHNGSVGLYWLNYQGNLLFYRTIARHGTYTQVTFRKNAWVVLNSSFNCVGFFVANGARQYVIR